MRRICLGWIFLLFISSCVTNKVVQTSGNAAEMSVKSEFQTWPGRWWSAKGKITVKVSGANLPLNITMRAEEGKAIWFSASALGLVEVARGLIHEDSLLLLDKMNNRCLRTRISNAGKFLPVNFGIRQLQHFLMGRVFWDSLFSMKSQINADTTHLNGTLGNVGYSASLLAKYQLLRAKADLGKGNELKLVNEDFRLVSGYPVSFYKEVEGKSEADPEGMLNNRIRLEFNRFEFLQNAPDMEFSLPVDCEPLEIK